MAAWGSACVAALVVALRRWRTFAIARWVYWVGLARPWKLVTFAVAFVGIVAVAPRSGDPTWDYWDATFMALLTFTTAPWTLGVLVRATRGRCASKAELYVAACVWLFSASFSYDLYIFLRDGHYPVTWWANLLASSGLYGCGGAMWSLRASASEQPTFAFLREDWPASLADGDVRRLLPYAAFFMFVVLAMLAPFLWLAARPR
jgi:hypothetical protein